MKHDLVCFSHLRWGFVFQRPNHLMVRFANERRVFFVEEPIPDGGSPRWAIETPSSRLHVLTPHLPQSLTDDEVPEVLANLVADLMRTYEIEGPTFWYYTPMALRFTRHLRPRCTVYDCMDELTGFANAPRELKDLEQELLSRAAVVFTGGMNLYEAKRSLHPNVHGIPSSVDVPHFAAARAKTAADPDDQASIVSPRIGYFGVIDERLDLELLGELAEARPSYQFVMIGPVVKIDPATLPRQANIHYLGGKAYAELPRYLAHWDVGMMPFAINEATRFISPTKTPEYLAAGRPVVSTPIIDVVNPYGTRGLAHIAADSASFARAIDEILHHQASSLHQAEWLARVDAFLASTSWDSTWSRMNALLPSADPTSKEPMCSTI